MKTIYDGNLVTLIRKYLVSGVMENGVVSLPKVGILQGDKFSLIFNIMLNELDK